MQRQADIGLIGLAVMGENLVLNMSDHGFTVAVFNRTVDKVHHFTSTRGKRPNIIGTENLQALVSSLARPRKVMLMVKAGDAVDQYIDQLVPLLEAGDIIIDGGNSNYLDSIRRHQRLATQGILFVGSGVSGGELGALTGPSLMPGGSVQAWPHIAPIFQAIAAKAADGQPCCQWIGPDGSGHFTKMVHNGIEYGDMQIIGEAYHIMRDVLKLPQEQMAEIFHRWNQDELQSYLIEITADILEYKEPDGSFLVDKILDCSGQKGTGKWTVINALEFGVPLTLITEAVFARAISSLKTERENAQCAYPAAIASSTDKAYQETMINHLRHAMYAAKIVSYAQGFALLKAAAQQHAWPLNYAEIALMWRGGCIIRSAFLDKIADAFHAKADLDNLLLAPFFQERITTAVASWRFVVAAAVQAGIPVPCFAGALAYFDTYRCNRLPANLLQAQRDYFGAHTYERTDRPRGEFFHTNWTGKGGNTSSTNY